MYLYKYLPPDRIDVLENAAIRFTQPDQLNDPFESRPCMTSIREHFRTAMTQKHPLLPPQDVE